MPLTDKDNESNADNETDISSAKKSAARKLAVDPSVVNNVPVSLDAYLGSRELTVAELLALENGAVLELDASLNHSAELRLNDQIIARGEIVAVGDNFGIRITEISD